MPQITLIATIARNVIVNNINNLPWYLKESYIRFNTLTRGHPIVMCSDVWEALPRKPLISRRNIVVTQQENYNAEGAELALSLEAAIALYQDAEQVCIIGGAELYAQGLKIATKMELTQINDDFSGDATFPQYDRTLWSETHRRDVYGTLLILSFVTYNRKPQE